MNKKTILKPGSLVKFTQKALGIPVLFVSPLPSYLKQLDVFAAQLRNDIVGIHIETTKDKIYCEKVLFEDNITLFKHDDLMLASSKIRSRKPDLNVKFTGATYETEKEFWDLVDGYGYWTKTRDAFSVINDIQARLSRKEMERLDAVHYRLCRILRKRIQLMIDGCCSDDSFGDLVSHIIGMGKNEFDAVMLDPSKARIRALSHDYEEGFCYLGQFNDAS